MLAFLFFNLCLAQNYETTVEGLVFSSSSRTIITQDVIEKSQARDLPSLLQTVANISITSTPFQATSISMRGGDSGHILILLDGIPFYDPSTIQRTGNISSLSIKSIKRIEIIKGSQSVLYGGQALGGVIKIETLSNEPEVNAYGELGNQNLLAAGAEVSKNNFSAKGFYKEKQTPSPAKHSSKNYPFDQQNLDLSYQWKNFGEGYLKASYLRDHSFSPSSDINYKIVDVDHFKLSNEQSSVSSQILFKESNWQPKLTLGLQNGLRFYDFPVGPLNTTALNEDYKSHTHFIRVDMRPVQNKEMNLDFGLSYAYEDFIFEEFNLKQADAFLEQRGVFVKITNFLNADTALSYGVRAESWSHQNPENVYQIGLTHKQTKMEISTGFKTPSLYQLYSNYGNPDLKAEKGNQISVSQEIENLSLTIFYSQFKNLIAATGTFPAIRYTNIKESETRGAEASYTKEYVGGKSLILNMIYQEPKDLGAHAWLPRRALLNTSLRFVSSHRNGSSNIEILNVGTRKDVGPSGNVRLPSYTVLNFGYNFNLQKNGSVYLRLDNIGNSRHQETYGYYAEGLSGVVGWAGFLH